VEDDCGLKHIKGDLYSLSPDNSDGVCVGYFNPIYQADSSSKPQYFLRLEDDFQFLYDTEGKYESLFNQIAVPLKEYHCAVGFTELIADLELITCLYAFMSNIVPDGNFEQTGLTGVINGAQDHPTIKVIKIMDESVCTQRQVIDFIKNKVLSVQLDDKYHTRIFRTLNDFSIWYVDGKQLNVVKGECVENV
jgi:hypothetical protein